MVELLGWLGVLLLLGTLMPFILRRLHLWRKKFNFLSRYHHHLALTSLVVLTLHGFSALTGRHGRGWGALAHFQDSVISGILAWLVLLALCLVALSAARRRPFKSTHCWLVVLLVVLVMLHT